jgi:hypothetical protein
MFYRMLTITLLLTGAFVFPVIASSSIQGDVRGVDGRALNGAEIRLDRKDRTGPAVTTTTDARGHYSANGLPVGLYQISVVVNGSVRSALSVKTADRDARIDFDLKPAATKKVKHYVWMEANTGSHIGGRWVEVEDSSAVAGTGNVDRQPAELARELLRHQNNSKSF